MTSPSNHPENRWVDGDDPTMTLITDWRLRARDAVRSSTVIKTAATITAFAVGSLTVGSVVSAGAAPRVPVLPCTTVTVQSGDTVGRIAESANVDLGTIGRWNPQITNLDEVWPGDVLCVTMPEPQIGEAQTIVMPEQWQTAEVPATRNGSMQPSDDVRAAVWSYFGDLGMTVYLEALQVARCESDYDVSAHRTTSRRGALIGDRGLFQINHIHDDWLRREGVMDRRGDLLESYANSHAARLLYDREGWGPWYMSASCHGLR